MTDVTAPTKPQAKIIYNGELIRALVDKDAFRTAFERLLNYNSQLPVLIGQHIIRFPDDEFTITVDFPDGDVVSLILPAWNRL